jgi:hypothetical protein
MSIALSINDKTSSGDVLLERIVNFSVERITVTELIEARVSQEVESYNKLSDGEFKGLVQPSDAEVVLNGFKLAQGQSIDIEKQTRAAIQAFKSGGFFLLVNDRQLTELDDAIMITPNTSVVFLKVVRLVGG